MTVVDTARGVGTGPESPAAVYPGALGTVGVFSPGILRIPHLAGLIGAGRVVFLPSVRRVRVDTVVGWGRKANTRRARRYAEAHGARYVMLEDGFLRSVGLGVLGSPPLSVVVDDLGIYYDATTPSRLERLLEPASGEPDLLADAALLERARRCMSLIREHRLSKYNEAPEISLAGQGKRVLVVDQTAGDLSVRLGLAHAGGFDAMLEAALAEHPDAEVVVKVHPDVVARRRYGYLNDLRARPRVRLLVEPANPISLLEQVEHVYVTTSLLGMEALVVGRPVTCFGVPFYAGWGLTDDRVPVPRRSARRTIEQVFAAAYLLYARYVDPETGEPCGAERVIEHLALQRTMADANAGTILCVGFSAWKRGFVPAFLKSPRNRVWFVRNARTLAKRTIPADARILVWGSRESPEVRAVADRHRVPVWRMEDGFLRSVGLGSDLHVPASLVVDRLGIYYDPTRPSELEQILEAGGFGVEELDRARALREAIVRQGVSKYNVGAGAQKPRPPDDGRRRILVVGQVEDDASIRLGCQGVRRNGELLRAVREASPQAWILYKPHPDVVSGNRAGGLAPDALRACDEVVEDAPVGQSLAVVDEVHTLTSLVGFEALLRGLRVVVWGQPFYAGWGLTEDRAPIGRRTRRLSLDELVAGALIRYPRYVSPRTGAFTTPEVIVDQLVRARAGATMPIRRTWPGRQLLKVANLVTGITRR